MKKIITYVDGVAHIGNLQIACFTTAELVLKGGITRPNLNDARALAIAVVALREELAEMRQKLHSFTVDLEDLGFGADDEISGVATIDVVNYHLPYLQQVLK